MGSQIHGKLNYSKSLELLYTLFGIESNGKSPLLHAQGTIIACI